MSWAAELLDLVTASAFPFYNVYQMMHASPPAVPVNLHGSFSGGPLPPYYSPKSYAFLQFASLPTLCLALTCWVYTVDIQAMRRGWEAGWVLQILLRDLAIMTVFGAGWDWLLYFSPMRNRLSGYKFSSEYPGREQLQRDLLWTVSATLLSSLQEVLLMHWWAGGYFTTCLTGAKALAYDTAFFGSITSHTWATPPLPLVGPIYFHELTLGFMVWVGTMFYWRIGHFYFTHRLMHPWWNIKNGLAQGDVGAFLYRWVHSHHHKSHNPTALSGISMLHLESITYFSAALLPLPPVLPEWLSPIHSALY